MSVTSQSSTKMAKCIKLACHRRAVHAEAGTRFVDAFAALIVSVKCALTTGDIRSPTGRIGPGRRRLEVCMGMGKTGIPWDSHGNGSKIIHGMGMGIKCMGMGV